MAPGNGESKRREDPTQAYIQYLKDQIEKSEREKFERRVRRRSKSRLSSKPPTRVADSVRREALVTQREVSLIHDPVGEK